MLLSRFKPEVSVAKKQTALDVTLSNTKETLTPIKMFKIPNKTLITRNLVHKAD